MKNILVPIDFSEHSINALEKANHVAEKIIGQVSLVHVKEPGLMESIFRYSTQAENEYSEQLTKKVEELKKHYKQDYPFYLKEGKMYREVVKLADELDAYMIIMGTHGTSGFEEFWIGSNSYKVVTAANCPVMTLRENFTKKSIEEIVLPIDSSIHTRHKVPMARDLAQYFKARIHVIAICTNDEDSSIFKVKQYAEQVTNNLMEHHVSVKQDVLFGENIADLTVKYAERTNADLITMMTEQEVSPSNLFLGPFAQQMVNHSPVPVVSVHPDTEVLGSYTY